MTIQEVDERSSAESDINSSPIPKIKTRQFGYVLHKGDRFTKTDFAEESGIRKAYLDGVKDKQLRKDRIKAMQRFIHEQIQFMLDQKAIECIGRDTFKKFKKNGIRGSVPLVYEVLKAEIKFAWDV